MTKDEALKLALEALEAVRFAGDIVVVVTAEHGPVYLDRTIAAIREARAEQPKVWVTPKLRPLAKLAKELDGVVADVEQGDGFDHVCLDTVKYVRDELAEHPAQQEPFCYHDGCNIVGKEYAGHSDVFALYTHPQAREPLTDEEIEDIWADCPADWDDKINVLTLARAIEAAHGIKGEA